MNRTIISSNKKTHETEGEVIIFIDACMHATHLRACIYIDIISH
jgi:hypothetical protein